MKDKIVAELIDLELPLNGKGFMYWTDMLMFVYENQGKEKIKVTNLYRFLAEKYNSNYGAVERVVRLGRVSMEKRFREKYNVKYGKITVDSILKMFVLKIF